MQVTLIQNGVELGHGTFRSERVAIKHFAKVIDHNQNLDVQTVESTGQVKFERDPNGDIIPSRCTVDPVELVENGTYRPDQLEMVLMS